MARIMDWIAYREGFDSWNSYVSEYVNSNGSDNCFEIINCPYGEDGGQMNKKSSWEIGMLDARIIGFESIYKDFIDRFYDGIEPE